MLLSHLLHSNVLVEILAVHINPHNSQTCILSVTTFEQLLFQKPCCTMSNQAITFHLSKSDTTVSRSTLLRLPGQFCQLTPRAWVEFIIHHMFESLLKRWAYEDRNSQSLTCQPILHHFIPLLLLLHIVQVIWYLFNSHVAHEWSTICLTSFESDDFGC